MTTEGATLNSRRGTLPPSYSYSLSFEFRYDDGLKKQEGYDDDAS